jgi:hypothetical protein
MNGMFMESKENLEEAGYGASGFSTEQGSALIVEAAFELGLIEGSDEMLQEKSIVKLDRAARMSHLRKVSTMTVASEYNDPLYKKLAAINRTKAMLIAKIEQKYSSKGNARMRETLAAARQSGTMVQKTRTMSNSITREKPTNNHT